MYAKYIKRILDILISLIALPFVLSVILVFAPLIFLEDRGPVFYNAPRLGKDGRIFNMYKLRSMRVNAEDIRNADGSAYNSESDGRLTKTGRFIRKTSIDELPQFLNVLKGDMSLIGPRAHLAGNFRGMEFLDENRRKRLSVRPGITGYNQAYFRNSVPLEEKIRNDVYYAEHLTFAMDVKVLFRTFSAVLLRKNIYADQNKQ